MLVGEKQNRKQKANPDKSLNTHIYAV